MARKLPDKIEDWTAPWEAPGAELEPETVKKLVFDLMHSEQRLKDAKGDLTRQLGEATTKLTAAEQQLAAKPEGEAAKDQEITQLRTENQKLKTEGRPEDQRKIQRLTVANNHGLTAKDAERLVGETDEELEEDAKELAERLGISKGDDGTDSSGEPQGGQGPASQRPVPASQLGNGRKPGQGPVVISAEEILAGKTPLDSALGGGLHLAPLTR